MSTMEMELSRLNKELSEITSKRIRIVWYMINEDESKSIFDIVEWSRKYICTKVRGELSAEGKDIIRTRMSREYEDWSLITLENASEIEY